MLSCSILSFSQNRYYVKEGASGAGTSWTDAFGTLQEAITAAAAGDEIWVAKGNYLPVQTWDGNADIANQRGFTFYFNFDVRVYGGFPNIGNPAMLSRDWEAHPTILSGDFSGDDIYITDTNDMNFPATGNDENAYTIVHTQNVSDAFVLDGFQLKGGNANHGFAGTPPTSYRNGGAWFNEGTSNSSNPTIRNCTFSGNAANTGGAIYNLASTGGTNNPSLIHCTFSGNAATSSGGAIRNNGIDEGMSSPSLIRCTFLGNRAKNSDGGAIYNSGLSDGTSSPSLINCTFSGNSALRGGAIYNLANTGTSSPNLTNCSFSGNWAEFFGGAMFNNNSNGINTPSLTNCTFSSNWADLCGGAMYNRGFLTPSTPNLTNCIIWNNQDDSGLGTPEASIFNNDATPVITYSLVQSITVEGDGNNNIQGSIDPLFLQPINPADAPTTVGNLSLLACSPVINLGNNAALPMDDFDLDYNMNVSEIIPYDVSANPRIFNENNGGVVDLGAYELQELPPTPPTLDNCSTDRLIQFNETCDVFLPDYRDLATLNSDCQNEGLVYTQAPTPQTLLMEVGRETVTLTASHPNGDSDECSFNLNVCPPAFIDIPNVQMNDVANGDYSSIQTAVESCTNTAFSVTEVIIVGNIGERQAFADLSFDIGGEPLECIVIANEIGGALAVDWLEVKATVLDNQTVELQWQVQTDKVLVSFTIERSANGIDFKPIHYYIIEHRLTSNNIFKYKDETPLTESNYYRIVQYPVNGQPSLSPVRLVNIKQDDFLLYPNPTYNGCSLILPEVLTQATLLQIFHTDGRLLHSLPLAAGQQKFNWSIKALNIATSGIYFLHISLPNGEFKVLKLSVL